MAQSLNPIDLPPMSGEIPVIAQQTDHDPAIFPAQYKDQVRQSAAKVVETDWPRKV